jgi:hypothetical protein
MLLCCCGGTCTTGVVSGMIRGCNSLVLPGASVVLKLAGATVATTTTDSAGAYSFTGLAAGSTYTITVSKTLFTTWTSSNLTVHCVCDSTVWPSTLYLTTNGQTITLTETFAHWQGAGYFNVPGGVQSQDNTGHTCTDAGTTMLILFDVSCAGSNLSVQYWWGSAICGSFPYSCNYSHSHPHDSTPSVSSIAEIGVISAFSFTPVTASGSWSGSTAHCYSGSPGIAAPLGVSSWSLNQ